MGSILIIGLGIVPKFNFLNQGWGGKALTMTMTPRNLTHGQWSKKLNMAMDILESAPWSMVNIVIYGQI